MMVPTTKIRGLVLRHFGREDGIEFSLERICDDVSTAAEAALAVVSMFCSNAPCETPLLNAVTDFLASQGRNPYAAEAHVRLANEVHTRASVLAEQLADEWTPDGYALCANTGLLTWDARFVEHLGATGQVGNTYAAQGREVYAARVAEVRAGANPALLWKSWVDSDIARLRKPRWLGALIDASWRDIVEPQVERLRGSAALPRGVVDNLARAKRGATTRPSTPVGFEALSRNGVVVAHYAALEQSDLERIRRGALVVRKPLAERVIRTLVLDAFEQFVNGTNPYTRLTYMGGLETLANRAGITKKGASEEIRDLLEALQSFRGPKLNLPDVLMARLLPACPGRRAELVVTLGTALAPGYASELKRNGKRNGETWLLPVLPVPSLPAVDNKVLANLYDLQWQMLVEMRGALSELESGWDLSKLVVAAADRSEVDRRTANQAAEHWLTAPDAWLRHTTRGRVTLLEEGALNLWRNAENDANAKAERRIRSHRGRKAK
jgi:hypothetical protein